MNIDEINNKIENVKEEINSRKTIIDDIEDYKIHLTKENKDNIFLFKAAIIAHLVDVLIGVGLPYWLCATPDVTEHKKIDLSNNKLIEEESINNYKFDKEYISILTITSPWIKTEDGRYFRNESIYSSNNKHDLNNLTIEEIEEYFVIEENKIQYKDSIDSNDETKNTSIILDEYSYKGKDVDYKRTCMIVFGIFGFTAGFCNYFFANIKKYKLYKSDMKCLNNQKKEENEKIISLSAELYSYILDKESLEKEEYQVKSLTK